MVPNEPFLTPRQLNVIRLVPMVFVGKALPLFWWFPQCRHPTESEFNVVIAITVDDAIVVETPPKGRPIKSVNFLGQQPLGEIEFSVRPEGPPALRGEIAIREEEFLLLPVAGTTFADTYPLGPPPFRITF